MSETRRPNVLFIAVDDLNDWIGALAGHPQARSPNIDALARRGLLFTNAHACAPLCAPSREALFTGLRPSTTDFYTNADVDERAPRLNHTTIPELFRAHDYHVTGAGKLLHPHGNVYPPAFDAYGPDTDFKGGPFTRSEMLTTRQNPTYRIERGQLQVTLPLNRLPDDRRPFRKEDNSFDWGPLDVSDDALADGRIADWAASALKDGLPEPFFLGAGFFRPHQPLYVPRSYYEEFPPGSVTLPETPERAMAGLPRIGVDYATLPNTGGMHKTVVKFGQWRDAVSAYLACVRFVDAQIGAVLDALRRSPYADNTVVVLWSDHGYHLGQKHHWAKWAGWEQSSHVPLIIAPPESDSDAWFAPGRRCDEAVSLVDLYPTLIDLCDLNPPDHTLDGQSLRPLLENPDARSGRAAITTFGHGNHAVRTRRWRLIRYYDGSEELYDHYADPSEWHNRAGDPAYAARKRALADRLPGDDEVRHFVRLGPWQAVIYDDDRDALLFNTGTGWGLNAYINDEANLAAEHPDVMTRITEYLGRETPDDKHVVIS